MNCITAYNVFKYYLNYSFKDYFSYLLRISSVTHLHSTFRGKKGTFNNIGDVIIQFNQNYGFHTNINLFDNILHIRPFRLNHRDSMGVLKKSQKCHNSFQHSRYLLTGHYYRSFSVIFTYHPIPHNP